MKNTIRVASLILIAILAGCAHPPETPSGPPTSHAQAPATSLKDALRDRFLIGAALDEATFTDKNVASAAIVKSQFSAIVPENCMKSMYLQPQEGQFNFQLADQFVAFGEQNGIAVTGHCLIWHSQLPPWFTRDASGALVTAEVLKQRMKSHINTVVTRYKGRIRGWDVVNEAILEDGSYRQSDFYKILGEEFIPLAFQYAHEADPAAELYYNDYNEWYPEKRKTVTRLIDTLKKRGLRIDAIGLQGHIDMTTPGLEEYQATIDDYVKAGVKVCVTELDLSALPEPRRQGGANIADIAQANPELNPYTSGLPDAVARQWTERMMGFFNLFLKNSDNVLRVTVWGVSDKDSWKNNFPVPGRTDYPLLFDRDYHAKPIVDDIIDAARKNPR